MLHVLMFEQTPPMLTRGVDHVVASETSTDGVRRPPSSHVASALSTELVDMSCAAIDDDRHAATAGCGNKVTGRRHPNAPVRPICSQVVSTCWSSASVHVMQLMLL